MTAPPPRLLLVVALLGAGVAGTSAVPRPGDGERPAATQAAVVGADLVCPEVRQQPGAVLTAVAAGLPEGSTAQLAAGPLGGAPVALAADGAAVVGLGDGVAEGALTVRARGDGASSLSAGQTTLVSAGAVRGLAAVPCVAARTDAWLVGGATTVGDTAELILANPDEEPAVVDVTVLTAEGPTDPRPGSGIAVPAGARVAVPLDRLAPDRSALAVRVRATRGRVASAVRHERSDGVVPRGVAYAAAGRPAQEVVVPGLPSGPGGRSLVLGNPGLADLRASIEVTTTDGQLVPAGLDEVAVPAESTVVVDLSAVLGATPATARVTATGGPLVAAGVAEDAGAGDVRDLAYLAPAVALPAPVVVPDVTLGAAETTVLVSALGGDAVVEIAVLPVAGQPPVPAPPRRLDVPGGRTVAVPASSLVPAGATGRVALQVTPDDTASPVHAAVVVQARPADGPLLAATTLAASAPVVERPAVVRDPGVGAGLPQP